MQQFYCKTGCSDILQSEKFLTTSFAIKYENCNNLEHMLSLVRNTLNDVTTHVTCI